jgi:hypothetical protein
MDWVLDSSIALALALPDETSEHADHFFRQITSKSVLWVPALEQKRGQAPFFRSSEEQ